MCVYSRFLDLVSQRDFPKFWIDRRSEEALIKTRQRKHHLYQRNLCTDEQSRCRVISLIWTRNARKRRKQEFPRQSRRHPPLHQHIKLPLAISVSRPIPIYSAHYLNLSRILSIANTLDRSLRHLPSLPPWLKLSRSHHIQTRLHQDHSRLVVAEKKKRHRTHLDQREKGLREKDLNLKSDDRVLLVQRAKKARQHPPIRDPPAQHWPRRLDPC